MTNQSERSYFDLHITGLGYLNRIREVRPTKGEPFLACEIAALSGASDDVSYTRFDVRVSGSDAQHLVRRCYDAVQAEKKVMVGFKLGDLWTDIFTYQKGKRIGEQAVSLKARLLFISWIKIDGVMKYKAEPRQAEEQDEAEGPAAPAPEAPPEAAAPKARKAASRSASKPAGEPVTEREPALADSF